MHPQTCESGNGQTLAYHTQTPVGEHKRWRTETKPARFAAKGRCTKTIPTPVAQVFEFWKFRMVEEFEDFGDYAGARRTQIKPRHPPAVSLIPFESFDAVESDSERCLLLRAGNQLD